MLIENLKDMSQFLGRILSIEIGKEEDAGVYKGKEDESGNLPFQVS